jgi:hypothetical protein
VTPFALHSWPSHAREAEASHYIFAFSLVILIFDV